MRKYLKILVRIGLVSVMVFGSIGGFAAAASGNAAGTVPVVSFTDLNQAPWAQKNIIRMTIRNIVTGYTDGTFKPNNQIRQAEAVILAVREMGLGTQAEEQAGSANLTLPSEFGKNIPSWAKGYVAVAWQQGLIKPEEKNFKWDAPANRAWVAQLTIRLLGIVPDTSVSGIQTGFTDDSSIPVWAQGYVKAAVDREIFVGYSDGTFQPGRAVTRAEIATVLANSEQYMTLNDVMEATIEDVNYDNLIVYDNDGNLFRLYLASGAWIFIDNQTVDLSQLSDGDSITVVKVGSSTAGFIDVTDHTDSEDSDAVEGEVVKVDTSADEIRIEDEDGTRTTYEVANDVDVIIDGNDGNDLHDVDVGDNVELLIEDDVVIEIDVSRDAALEGVVTDVDTTDNEITIEDEDGDEITYDVDSDADITIDGDTGYDLEDIDVDYYVELTVNNGDVTDIEAFSEDTMADGEVVRVDVSTDEIRLENEDGDRTTYDVDNDVDVTIDGDDGYDLSDVEVGDNVEIRIVDGNVTEIEVVSATTDFVVGELYSVDTDNETIRIKDRDGDRTTYEVDSGADIETDSDSSANLDDLQTGQPVKIELDSDDQVTEIIQGKMKSGILRSLDSSDENLEIERSSGSNYVYDYSDDVIVEYDGDDIDLDELNDGDEVDIYMFDDDTVYLIVVTDQN